MNPFAALAALFLVLLASGAQARPVPGQNAAAIAVEMTAWQVRIEQTATIRISPRASGTRPVFLDGMPDGALALRYTERRMGKCVPIARIAGMQTGSDNQLMLFMRDQRIVSAALEKSCRARDFYSGFYLERNPDGKLCVDRDVLLARNGANCKLTRIRQLVPVLD